MIRFLLSTLLLLIVFGVSQAQVVYVNTGATGSNNGTSWGNAYTDLTEALLNTSTGEIWVAQGSYQPTKDELGFTPAGNAQKTFVVPSGVKVYGGFIGTETLLSQRNWRTNITILEGSFGGSSNSYHIIKMNNASQLTELDGFTIQNGSADVATNSFGGGINMLNSSATIQNCTFKTNYSVSGGGAAYVAGGSPQFLNCIFDDNTAVSKAGAMNLSSTTIKIANCLFINNETTGGDGGAIQGYDAPGEISNCTFSKNIKGSSNENGKALCLIYGFNTSHRMDINNCIFSGNLPAGSSDELYSTSANANDTVIINNVMVDGGTPALSFVGSITRELNNIITTSGPLFVNAANDNYELECQSLAVNAGQDVGLGLPAEDLAGNPRVLKGAIDLGAYENNGAIGIIASDTAVCAGGFVTLQGSCDSAFTWSNGVVDGMPFAPTSTTTYTCTGQPSGQTAQITIQVVNIQDETVNGPNNTCLGDIATITTVSSVAGVDYYLLDSATGFAIDGPTTGTGSGLSFSTNPLMGTKTYEVYGAVGGMTSDGHTIPNTSGCLDFDGSNDEVNTSLMIAPINTFTIEAWIYPRGTTTDVLCSNYGGGGASVASNEILFDTYGGTSNGRGLRLVAAGNTVLVNNVLTLNEWNHVAAICDNGAITLLVDGIGVKTGTVTGTISATARPITIGCHPVSAPNSHFNGKIDELRMWSKALSASELNGCINGGKTGLLAYYDFEDGMGSTTLTDRVAGNNGTLNVMDPATDWTNEGLACGSPVMFPNTTGSGLDFDGSNDQVNTPLTIASTNTFTIEAWIYPRGTTTDVLCSNYGGGGASVASNEILFDTYGGTSNGRGLRLVAAGNTVLVNNVLTLNQWNHVAAICNNGNVVLLVNGASVKTGTITGNVNATARPITIGCHPVPAPNSHFNGVIDELRIWNKALTQTALMNNMNQCLVGNETDLLAYYNFEDGSGLVVNEIVNNADGTMVSMDAATDWVDGKFSCNPICEQTMSQTITIIPGFADTTVTQINNILTATATGVTYQWLDCGNSFSPINGATNASFTPMSSGDYAVEVTNNGCVDTSSCRNIVLVGLNEVIANSSIQLYPNPVKETLNIDLRDMGEQVSQLQIVDVLGKVLHEEQVSSSLEQINVQSLSSGIYFVRMIQGRNLIQLEKFIKE